jgi:hypothetical protein
MVGINFYSTNAAKPAEMNKEPGIVVEANLNLGKV